MSDPGEGYDDELVYQMRLEQEIETLKARIAELESGIHPAKNPMPNGFNLAAFAPSLDGDAGESLDDLGLRDDSTTPQGIATRLGWLADGMERLAVDMDYFGGLSEIATHGRELLGAARIARGWAAGIEAETQEGVKA